MRNLARENVECVCASKFDSITEKSKEEKSFH